MQDKGGGDMSNLIIRVSMDKQICGQCGKRGKGYYEAKNAPGKYICQKCVLKNIEIRAKSVRRA